MKIYINRKPVLGPWGGGNLWVKSAYEFFPSFGIEVVDLSEDPDVILLAGMSQDNNGISASQAMAYKEWRKKSGKDVKIVFRVNENDSRKNTRGLDLEIVELSQKCDLVVFVSKWLMEYFQPHIKKPIKSVFIHNGVDSNIFKPLAYKNTKTPISIVTHHWSDNPLKGFDVYEELDRWISTRQDFAFTYIGRDRKTFLNSKVVPPLFGTALGEELSKHDVYVSASRFDPGPNHIIEAISCKLPTYVHRDGGGCVEFAGKDHVYNDMKNLLQILENKDFTLNQGWFPSSWNDCIKNFVSAIKNLHY